MPVSKKVITELTLDYIEDIQWQLSDHQRLLDYLINEIDELSEKTIDNKRIYTYMLALSSQRIKQISLELYEYTQAELDPMLP